MYLIWVQEATLNFVSSLAGAIRAALPPEQRGNCLTANGRQWFPPDFLSEQFRPACSVEPSADCCKIRAHGCVSMER